MSDPDGPVLACLYDWEHDSFQSDIDLYASLAQRTGGPVLEPACGSGRILESLARRGLHVTGFDSSPGMVARARDRLADLSDRAILSCADLRDPIPAGPFRLIVLALDALGLLRETAEQVDLLQRLAATLAPDGLLVLDLVHAGPLWDQPQGIPVLQQASPNEEIGARVSKWVVRRLFPATQQLVLDCFYDIVRSDGGLSRVEQRVELRYFSRFEIDLLLSGAGLCAESIHGDYGLEAFGDESPRMIVLATAKRGQSQF